MTRNGISPVAWAVCALVVAALTNGCTAPAMSRMDNARAFEERGELAEAEKVYAGVMADLVSESEWSEARDARCRVRSKLARELVATLDPPNTTFEEIEEIRGYLDKCPGIEEFEAELSNAGIARAMVRFEAEVGPLLDQRRYAEATRAAMPFLRYLPTDHPYFVRVANARKAEIARLEEARKEYVGHPDAEAAFDYVIAMWKERDIGERPTSSRTDELAVYRAEPASVSFENSCASLLATKPTSVPPGADREGDPFTASATLRRCAPGRSVNQAMETYYETIEVVEEVPKVVSVNVQKTRKTVTQKRTCYTSSKGFGSGCVSSGTSTKYDTYTAVERKVVMVKQRVRKQVARQRPALQATDTLRAEVAVTVELDGATSTVVVPVSVSLPGPFVPPGTPQESVPGPSRRAIETDLANAATASISRASRALAARMRRKAKADEWQQAMSTGDPTSALDAAAATWLIGETVESEPRFVELFGFDVFATEELEGIGSLPVGLSETLYSSSFTPRTREIPFNSVFRRGYPEFMAIVSGQLIDPDPRGELLAQPDRTSWGANIQLSGRIDAFDTRYAGDGIAGIFGYDMGVGVGYRTGDDYEAPVPPRETNVGEEGRVTTAFEFAFPIFVGWRAENFQLAAGLRADWRNFAVGHSWSQGGAVLATSRLMFRIHPMYPWIFEGWGLNVFGGANEFRGLQLDIPVRYEGWVRIRAEELRIKTRVYGLNENDPVVVDDALVEELRVGWVVSF